jgi:tetratricopeptide (TPR) repeat protein
MRKKIVLLALVVSFFAQIGYAQLTKEEYRKNGFEYRLNENYDSAIISYEEILQQDPNDYDARLALARLYSTGKNYSLSEKYYSKILVNDSTDTEAWSGLGDLFLKRDKTSKAIYFYQKAVHYLPRHVPYYFSLAKAYSWDNKLEEAITTYQQILQIDSTYSEAWAGIGKMYYWQEKPYKAKTHYEKALQLDPLSIELRKDYQAIKDALKFILIANFRNLNESEQNYELDALIQQYTVQKRLSDKINLSFSALSDHSKRDIFSEPNDTNRIYNSYWTVLRFIFKNQRVSLFGGYSLSDSLFSSYGLKYENTFDLGQIKVKNALVAQYQYFYYWNFVGGKSISDNITFSFKRYWVSGGITHSRIDSLLIDDYYNKKYDVDFNTQLSYNLSVGMKVYSAPLVKVAANYSFMNFKYKSPLYYSPFERNLSGLSSSLYHRYKKWYVFIGASYNIGTEASFEEDAQQFFQKEKLGVDNWSAAIELGYHVKPMIITLNLSKFYNPYYSNYLAGVSIKAEL